MKRIMVSTVLILGCNGQDFSTSKTIADQTQNLETSDSSQSIDQASINQQADSADTQEAAQNNFVDVSEPVSVAGAFLTCRYPETLDQEDLEIHVYCNVKGVPEDIEVESADFFAIDAEDNQLRIENVTRFEGEKAWDLVLPRAYLGIISMTAIIEFTDREPMTLSSTLAMDTVMSLSPAFWLGNEPNNLTDMDPTGENCVTFVSAIGKQNHINFTGFPSGVDGRMNDDVCSKNYEFLCRATSLQNPLKWMLSSGSGPFSNGQLACPDGYRFSLPMTSDEVGEVKMLIDQRSIDYNVWINLNDQNEENVFVIN